MAQSPTPRCLATAPRAFAAAAAFYAAATMLLVPNAWRLFTVTLTPFEGAKSVHRVWWFGEVIWRGREGSIWRLDHLLWPFGIALPHQSNGMLKELLAALLGGAANPVLAVNLIVLTTPVLVGLAGFALARRLLDGAFWPALLAGLMMAWTGGFALRHITPWLVSTEGTILFLGALLLLRDEDDKRRSAWLALGAGAAAALSAWICAQHLAHIALIAIVFAVDQAIARRWRSIAWLALAGATGFALASPLLWQTWRTFGGSLDAMSGGIRETSHLYSATITELLVPPPESLLGAALDGAPIRTRYTAYLGWAAIALAVVGVWGRRRHTFFLAALAIVAALLALGPVIALNQLEATQRLPPGPFALLIDAPIFSSMRVIRRFAITSQMALGLLAGFGALELWNRSQAGHWRALAIALPIVAQAADMRPVADPRTPWIPIDIPALRELAKDPRPFGVLDLPYGTGAHQFMRLGALHEHGVVWGIGGRLPLEQREELERAFAFPGVNRFARAQGMPEGELLFPFSFRRYNVRYIVVHDYIVQDTPEARDLRAWIVETIEDPATWAPAGVPVPRKLPDTGDVTIYEVPWKDEQPTVPATLSP